jgi:hypothetical protein
VLSFASVAGKAISANIFVIYNDVAIYHTAFCVEEQKKTNIMPVLMHRNILAASEAGAGLIELGRIEEFDAKSLKLDAYKAQFSNGIRAALRIRFGWIWIPARIAKSFGRSF